MAHEESSGTGVWAQHSDATMGAMVLDRPGGPLHARRVAMPFPDGHEVLIRVTACGVCRTDLHIVDGELPAHKTPLIPGHEIVGIVTHVGQFAHQLSVGDRIGVPWLGGSCRRCGFCMGQQENLCDSVLFTGYDRDGGYAQYVTADARYCLPLPERYDDLHAAPLLCAGLIGYRAYVMVASAQRIGLFGFGAAAHIIAQIAVHQGKQVFAYTRPGDTRSQAFARTLGAVWAGESGMAAPSLLDAAILFAPVGALVPQALAAVRKDGTVVCAGIHMSDIPGFPYALLWGERTLRSVANLTRADGAAFFALAGQVDLQTKPVAYRLEDANLALRDLRQGSFDGAAVLVPPNRWHRPEAAAWRGEA